jgi:hypothetical protein
MERRTPDKARQAHGQAAERHAPWERHGVRRGRAGGTAGARLARRRREGRRCQGALALGRRRCCSAAKVLILRAQQALRHACADAGACARALWLQPECDGHRHARRAAQHRRQSRRRGGCAGQQAGGQHGGSGGTARISMGGEGATDRPLGCVHTGVQPQRQGAGRRRSSGAAARARHDARTADRRCMHACQSGSQRGRAGAAHSKRRRPGTAHAAQQHSSKRHSSERKSKPRIIRTRAGPRDEPGRRDGRRQGAARRSRPRASA